MALNWRLMQGMIQAPLSLGTPPMPVNHPARPLDALWQASAIIWVLVAGEGLAVVLALASAPADGRLIYFGLASLAIQWTSLLTLGCLYLLRHVLARVRPQSLAYVTLALLMLMAWLVGTLAWLALADAWPGAQERPWRLFARLTGLVMAVGLLGLAAFQNHWRARQLAVQAKQYELEALKARIRPHFLFNTLNTGAALVHQRPGDAEQLLLDLADLFRAALAGPDAIALAQEIALARRYVEIESLRFGPRLRLHWQLPETLPQVTVPALSIQPLVENAIKHGVEPSADGGDVSIAVAAAAGMVTVTVRNPLPPAGSIASVGHQVGISSVRARIQAATQGLGRLETMVVDGHYVATLVLPEDGLRAEG